MRFEKTHFGEGVVCLGTQVACVIDALSTLRADLSWFAADIEPVGADSLKAASPVPAFIGTSDAAASSAREVHQFLFGVFVAVSGSATQLRVRDGGQLSTEDPPDADLGDALFELRTVDTSHISLAGADIHLRETVASAVENALLRYQYQAARSR